MSWGISSRLSPMGIQIALEKPAGDIFFQVWSLIRPDRQSNGTVFDIPAQSHLQASLLARMGRYRVPGLIRLRPVAPEGQDVI